MTVLSKDDIFGTDDLSYVEVEIPKWNGSVRIKTMSIEDQIKFEKCKKEKKDDSDLIFSMIVQCCVDADGKPLFSDTTEDRDRLSKKSSSAVLQLFTACLKVNDIGQVDIEKEAKNS